MSKWPVVGALALAAPGLVFAVFLMVLGGTVSVLQRLLGQR